METRKSIGERLLERLDGRDRFSRYARLNTGSRLGAYLFPDEITARPERSSSDELTHLSSAPYWARIHRLGNARLRRQQRLAALSDRTSRFGQLSAVRRLPGPQTRSMPFFGLSSVIADDFEVLAPLPVPVESTPEQDGLQPSATSEAAWVGAQRASSPWHNSEFRAARVAPRRETVRPLERATQRAPAASRAVEELRRSVAISEARTSAPKGASAAVGDTVQGSEVRPSARRIRRSLRRQPSPTRMVAVDYEAALPDDFLPPTRHAQGRMASKRGARRGLRSALSASPLMAALESPSVDASTPESASPSKRQRSTTSVGQTVGRRVAHRGAASPSHGPDAALLSASPVRTPATVAPSALTIVTPDQVVADAEGPTLEPRASAAPMVRALQRSEPPVQPLHERPLSQRAPVAVRPVKTRSGVFAPEATVLVPGVVPEEVTQDAAPSVATPRAQARSKAANIAHRRMEQRAPDLAGEPMVDSISERVHTPRRRTRPHRVARTPDGGFASAAEVLAVPRPPRPESEASPSEKRLLRASVADTTNEPKAAERIDSTSASTSVRRRIARTAPVSDAEVLAPMEAIEVESELPQGQHAAARVQRAPVVGESVRKALGLPSVREASSGSAVKTSSVPSTEAPKSRVSPKYFRSPLSHIQIRRSDSRRPDSRRPDSRRPDSRRSDSRTRLSPGGSITLQASAEHAVTEQASTQEAQRAALGQVQQAWQTSGRPLDWTSARIEVIQVPVAAVSASSEPTRSRRTETGAYVPATIARGGATRSPVVMPGEENSTVLSPAPAGPREDGAVDGVPGTPDSVDPTRPDTMTAPPSSRTGFDATVGGIGAGQVNQSMPIWAQRSTGRPRITGGDDLVQQLARASAPEEVVSVLMDQSDSVRRATSSLPTPVVQVIQQIKTEAVRAEGEAIAAERAAVETEHVRRRSQRRQGVRSTTRVARGMTGLSPGPGTARAPSAAMDRVSKLAKRLQELIAMAENQNRGGARQEVRMAEDSGAARAEGQSAPASAEEARNASADIDTLAREVTEQVTRELEMRRERRQEDPDGRSIWW